MVVPLTEDDYYIPVSYHRCCLHEYPDGVPEYLDGGGQNQHAEHECADGVDNAQVRPEVDHCVYSAIGHKFSKKSGKEL
jgi:hypothetical protein